MEVLAALEEAAGPSAVEVVVDIEVVVDFEVGSG
jgi:hypothetical protein